MGSAEVKIIRKSNRISKKVVTGSFDSYFSDYDENMLNSEIVVQPLAKSVKLKTVSKKAQDAIQKGNKYSQRKDVVYKRILRGCKKYYHHLFSEYMNASTVSFEFQQNFQGFLSLND